MKKYLPSLLVAILLLGYAVPAHATVVSWDAASSILQPLQALWTYTIKGNNFTATSSTATNTFPHASTTQLTVSNTQWLTALGTPAGTILAVDPNGKVIATTTSAGGVTSVTGTYPVVSTGGNTPALSLAFGTSTSNTWGGTQTFTNAPIFSALTGVLKGNGASALTVAVNGTDYTLITANTCSAGNHVSAITAAGIISCTADTGSGGTGLATTTPIASGNVLAYSGVGAGFAIGIATTSATINNGLTGTLTTLGGTQTIGLATINAGVLGAVTNGAVPTSQATSTLYGTGTGGQHLTWTNGVPTWTATSTYSAPLAFSGNNVTITNASAGVTGALTGTDWSTFNNKQATIAVTAPLRLTGATIDYTGLATTSQPSSSNLLTSNGAAGVYGTATSTLSASSPLTGSFTQVGSGGSLGLGTVGYANGGTGSTTAPQGQLLYGGATAYQSVATSSETCTSASGVTCTTHTVVGTGGGAIALSGIPNSSLTNSTISGVALGGTLAALTATNSTITFSGSYTGTAAQTVGLNLANANTWTGQQTFNTSAPIFGTITGSTQCLHVNTSGLLSGTGSDCGGIGDPFTHAAIGQSATTSAMGIGTTSPFSQFSVSTSTASSPFTSLFAVASSTNATLFNVLGSGNVGIGTSSPYANLSINAPAQIGDYFAIGSSSPVFSIGPAALPKFGLGSTSPWASLSIGGSAGIWPFSIGSSTGSLFGINDFGMIQSLASQPATTTALVLDWSKTGPQVEYRIGTSATTITLINATTSQWWGSRKVVWVCNPNATAGAITWAGVEWIGTAPTQTTTANQCDIYSLDITHATSSTAYKVAGTGGTGFQ